MGDMPKLLEEILADLQKEHSADLVAEGLELGGLKGAVSRILGPMYRTMLASASAPEKKP